MILFVGDKPSKKMKPGAKPFEGAACEKRLMEWIKTLNHRDGHQIVNHVDKDLGWHLIRCAYFDYKVVALGNKASDHIWNKYGIIHFKLPHPSGRNRQINDKEFIAKKLAECKEWLNGK